MAQIKFSDISNRTGLIQLIERATTTQSATGSSYPLKQKTLDINSALDQFALIAQSVNPKIKVDDLNQITEPAFSQNISSGIQSYVFLNDSSTPVNQILSIDRVEVVLPDGTMKRLTQLNRESVAQALSEYKKTDGVPLEYEIVGDTINLYPKPSYNTVNGLKLYVNRTFKYFLDTDTTQIAGIPNLFHDYLWLRPSYFWCTIKGIQNAKNLLRELEKMEMLIEKYYKNLNKDSTRMAAIQRFTPSFQNNK